MTGRGVDQILRHAGNPELHEPYVDDARYYTQLAEQAHGPIPRPVNDGYIWGDAIEAWNQSRSDVKVVNLETAVTCSNRFWKGKEIHYRMSPKNIGCLCAAKIDCCTLANNHVLDWGYEGLEETLRSLEHARIRTAGAGRNMSAAQAPAILEAGRKGRLLVFSFGFESSGIPQAWLAEDRRPGVNLLPNLSDATIQRLRTTITSHRRPRDLVVASVHWGGNWGYTIPIEQRRFAHRLIDVAGVDVVHGHSSHHVKGIEVYRNRLILFGCGDFVTDYEGISGYEEFRGDLALMYFARFEASSGDLVDLRMTPLQAQQMRLSRPSPSDVAWLQTVLDRECERLGTRVNRTENDSFSLHWNIKRESAAVAGVP
jgi:poly-gamma-glutamate synthesis protein (capsule biosynthesis protein)